MASKLGEPVIPLYVVEDGYLSKISVDNFQAQNRQR
jgi:hypothetical protein